MAKLNHTGTDRLRKGRVSIPFARYFITLCTEPRKPGLSNEPARTEIRAALRNLHRAEDFSLHCATIMPDHMHVLFTLGNKLKLSQTQGKFKTLTKSYLKQFGLFWQENYHDHRIRQDVSIEPFARYIFLNPYRKQIIPRCQSWPGWILNKHYKPEFLQHLQESMYPLPEWLEKEESIQDIINKDMETEQRNEA